jgi:hypothetical protein
MEQDEIALLKQTIGAVNEKFTLLRRYL